LGGGGAQINLLNLDTEGGELEILLMFFNLKKFPWVICVEELEFSAGSLPKKSKIYNIMIKNGYKFVAKTFYSSIYIRLKILDQLSSDYLIEQEF
jgi:hypothetical protein